MAVLTKITQRSLADNAVTSAHVQGDVIAAGDIAAGAIGTSELGADAVDGTKIADNAVNSEHVTAGAVDTAHIGDDQVTYAKMQNLGTANRVLGSSSTGLIGEVQVATDMVATDAVTSAKIATDAVTGAKIAAGIYLTASATQNITGALPATTNSCYLSQKFVVTGNITISGNMTLTKMSDDGVTTGFILDDGTTRTISGTGILTLGCLI